MELSIKNCGMRKSSDIAQGTGCSRKQPDFNLQKGIQLTGVNMTNLIEFMRDEMGIKIANAKKLRDQITKVRQLIKVTYEERVVEKY